MPPACTLAAGRERGLTCPGVDIEEFYDEDPRRRSSDELELGGDWHDAQGVRYELSWVEDTGELYVMREPVPTGWGTPFGGIHVWHAHSTDEKEIAGMTVAVLGVVPSRDDVQSILSGWEEAMDRAGSVEWLADRLRLAGVLAGAAPGGASPAADPPAADPPTPGSDPAV